MSLEPRILRSRRFVFATIGAWLVASAVVGALGVFATDGPPWPIAVFILVPIAGFIGAYELRPGVRAAIDSIPLWLITIAHTWRFVGVVFVIGAVRGWLPPQFGYPEGIGDVVAAMGAIGLGIHLVRGAGPRSTRLVRIWNVFGLVDLVSAITVGVLYSPSSFGTLRDAVSTRPMTLLPGSLIPTFFVPLFVLTHLLGLRRADEVSHDRARPAIGRAAAVSV